MRSMPLDGSRNIRQRATWTVLATLLLCSGCEGSGGGGTELVGPTTNASFTGEVVVCVHESCSDDSECTDCSGGGISMTCDLGICLPSCNPGSCSSGEKCEDTGSDDVCLKDCTTNSSCPSGQQCRKTYTSAQKLCLPEPYVYNACLSVTATSCSGTEAFKCPNWVVPCCGEYCPGNATCTSSCQCQCQTGYHAATCDGKQCYGSQCGSYYACKADASGAPDCRDKPTGFQGTCNCADGQKLSFSCGSTQTCEALCAAKYGG